MSGGCCFFSNILIYPQNFCKITLWDGIYVPIHTRYKTAMESPKDPTKISSKETTPVRQNNHSPLNRPNKKHLQNEFSVYGLHRESSPVGFGSSQDALEIGWGDSPEPLHNEKKFPRNSRTERPEQKESPRSTCSSFKYRRQRTINLPPKSPVDIAKYIAEVKELSKNVMKEINSQEAKNRSESPKHGPKMDGNQNPVTSTPVTDDLSKLIQEDDSINEDLIACTQSVELRLAAPSDSSPQNSKLGTNKDSLFDKELQSFFNEDDDWLSSVVINNVETKQTPRKGSFVKSRSDNNLESPRVESTKKVLSSQTNKQSVQVVNMNNSFRRTNSFDITKVNNNVRTNGLLNSEPKQDCKNSLDALPPLKKQKSFSICPDETKSTIQYSQEEIKKKREEAEQRKQAKLIERKRLEALKKLEMKKKNRINMPRQSSFVKSK